MGFTDIAVSWEAWFKDPANAATAGWFGRWRSYGWEFGVTPTSQDFGFLYTTTGKKELFSPGSYNDGRWHHVVLTRSVAPSALRLYVDGVEVAKMTSLSGTNRYGAGGAALGSEWRDNGGRYSDRHFRSVR